MAREGTGDAEMLERGRGQHGDLIIMAQVRPAEGLSDLGQCRSSEEAVKLR